jgi:DNA-binding transcriptional regulator PaaX
LIFRPQHFFADIAKLQKLKENTVRNAYYRSLKQGLIELSAGKPKLTAKGVRKVQPYLSEKLTGSYLMVVFDIPERERTARRNLRLLLKELSFRQVQKSVWISNRDHRKYLVKEIKRLKLHPQVILYESRQLSH